MKIWIFVLAVIFLLMQVSSASLESAVYAFTISGNELSGYCMISGEEASIANISLTPSFRVIENSRSELILRIDGGVIDHEVDLPLLVLPDKTEQTLIGITATKKEKLVWKTLIKTIDGDDDKVLIENGVDNSKITELDKDFSYLMEKISKEKTMPEYRFYLGEINPNEKVEINIWVGHMYEYYLPYAILAIIFCIILFFVLQFILKRL